MNRVDGAAWPAVVCLGEVLTDFVALDNEVHLKDAANFYRAAGGAPANVAVALARLGTTVAFVGKVGGDVFGLSLRETLAAEGVDVSSLLQIPSARTGLAFVGSDGRGGRAFVFDHQGVAHTLLTPEDVDPDLIAHSRIFHFGSVTLAAEPSRTATAAAAHLAGAGHGIVSFDPNVRLELWDSPQRALDAIIEMLDVANLVKVSSEELEFLTGASDPADACRILRQHGPALAIVTMGGDGSYYQSPTWSGYVPGISVKAVDSLGAGDAFMAGFLARLSDDADLTMLHDEDAMVRALQFANAVGAITTTRYGAMSALPTRAQVEEVIASV